MGTDIRDAFFDEISNEARQDPNIVIVTNDMDVFSLRKFKDDFPERFIDVGVAEQNLINVASGLASTGKKVIVFGILSFLTTRCYEQIKLNICGMNLPVIIVGIGPGLSFSFDGPTHHSTTDIGSMRLIPEMQILNPSEAKTAKESARISLDFSRPTLVRLDKGAFEQPFEDSKIDNGIVEHIPDSQNIIIYTGAIGKFVKHVHVVLQQNGDSWGVIELFQISPLPHSLLEILSNAKRVVVVEENSIIGGLFNVLAEVIVIRNQSIKVSQIGLRDKQIFNYGERDWLSQISGLIALETDATSKPGLNG